MRMCGLYMMLRTLWKIELLNIYRDVARLIELIGFVFLCLLIFQFVGYADSTHAPIVIWVTVLFAGMLHFGRSFDAEYASDGSRVIEGMRLIDGVASRIFWVKFITNVTIMTAVFLLGCVILSATSTDEIGVWLQFSFSPILLGIVGISALGTLFSVGIISENRREYLLPILCYPIAIPLILGVSQCLSVGISTQILDMVWLKLTAGCAILYVALAAMLFPQLMDAR